jgi:hypothetical protein
MVAPIFLNSTPGPQIAIALSSASLVTYSQEQHPSHIHNDFWRVGFFVYVVFKPFFLEEVGTEKGIDSTQ